MTIRCVEGIILHTVPYGNDDQILTLFTSDSGVIKLFCKRGKKKWHRYTPLMLVEVTCREKKSELLACEEIHLIQSYSNLRNEFSRLQAGCDLIRAIYVSQLMGKSAPLLYQLLIYYLDKLADVCHPELLVASFRLKVLKHEGVLALGSVVSGFSLSESEVLRSLALSQSYQQLLETNLSKELSKKIEGFFEHQLKNI